MNKKRAAISDFVESCLRAETVNVCPMYRNRVEMHVEVFDQGPDLRHAGEREGDGLPRLNLLDVTESDENGYP